MDFSIGGRMRRLERNQIDLMCQLRGMEQDMDIANSLAEYVNLKVGEKKDG